MSTFNHNRLKLALKWPIFKFSFCGNAIMAFKTGVHSPFDQNSKGEFGHLYPRNLVRPNMHLLDYDPVSSSNTTKVCNN